MGNWPTLCTHRLPQWTRRSDQGSGIVHKVPHCSKKYTASLNARISQLDDLVNFSTDLYYTFGQNLFSSLQMHRLLWQISSSCSHQPLDPVSHFYVTQFHKTWVPFLPTNESRGKHELHLGFSLSQPCWLWTMWWCRKHISSILNCGM